jgi:hypothetical protein
VAADGGTASAVAAVFDAWNELWVGAALAHDRFMRVDVTERRDRASALAGNFAKLSGPVCRKSSRLIRASQNEKGSAVALPLTVSWRADQVLRHRDLDAADFALGVDPHGLLVAVGPQIQVGGKSGSLDEHVDLAAAGGALQVAEDIPALLAPVAGDASPWLVTSLERSNL